MHRVTRKRLAGLLAALCIGEISLAVASWRDGSPVTSVRAPVEKQVVSRLASGLKIIPLGSFSAFVERPLFLASRRPPPAATAKSSSGLENASARGVIFGPYKFTGIVVTPRVRIAFVTEMKTGKSITLSEGEKLGNWRCAAIKPGSVTLERGARREIIRLRTKR
jgi:hypothetical protein